GWSKIWATSGGRRSCSGARPTGCGGGRSPCATARSTATPSPVASSCAPGAACAATAAASIAVADAAGSLAATPCPAPSPVPRARVLASRSRSSARCSSDTLRSCAASWSRNWSSRALWALTCCCSVSSRVSDPALCARTSPAIASDRQLAITTMAMVVHPLWLSIGWPVLASGGSGRAGRPVQGVLQRRVCVEVLEHAQRPDADVERGQREDVLPVQGVLDHHAVYRA